MAAETRNLSGRVATTPFPQRLAYTTKAAPIATTKGMAIDRASRGVNVNCVAPGWAGTEGVKDRVQKRLYSEEPVPKRTTVGTMGKPGEVAKLVAYAVSDESGYMTGSALAIDGGWGSYGYF